MNLSDIISAIDEEIAHLQQAKALLIDASGSKKVGRPAKVVTKTVAVKPRRTLSAAAKAKIAEAQRKRWAKAKQAAGVKKTALVAAKKAATAKKSATKKALTKSAKAN